MARLGKFAASVAIGACAALALAVTFTSAHAQQAAAPAGQAPAGAGARGGGGGRGAGGGVAPALFTLADTNKDGVVTRGELMAAIEKWYGDADSAKAGSITPEQ